MLGNGYFILTKKPFFRMLCAKWHSFGSFLYITTVQSLISKLKNYEILSNLSVFLIIWECILPNKADICY